MRQSYVVPFILPLATLYGLMAPRLELEDGTLKGLLIPGP